MKKDYLKILVVFVITIGVVFLGLNYLFYSKNSGPKSKAATSLFTVGYDTAAPSPAQNTDFNETISVKPSADVSMRGYSMRLNFDKTKLQLKSISYLLGVVSPDFGNTNSNLATINQNGSTYLQGEIENSNPFIISNGTSVNLVTLTFTYTGTTGTTIVDGGNTNLYTVDSAGSMIMNTANVPDLPVNGGGAIGTAPTCTSFGDNFLAPSINADNWNIWSNNNGSATATGEATLYLPASPDGTTKMISIDSSGKHDISGGDFSAEVILNSLNVATGKNRSGSQLGYSAVTNDSRYVAITRFSDISSHIVGELDNVASDGGYTNTDKDIGISNNSPIKVKITRTGTMISMYYDKQDGQGYQLLRQFDGFYSGPSRFYLATFNQGPDFPQASAKFDNFSLTCAPSVTPTGTSGTLVPGNVRLSLKLKFQGITATPSSNNSITVTGKLLNSTAGSQPVSGTGIFTANSSGIWSGTIGFNIPDVTGKFFLLISGDKLMAKKFCDSAPTESTSGTYHCSTANITVAVGDNNLDFSKVILLQGDLNQDGIIDSVDFGTVKNLLSKTDATSLSKADINHDGRVDTQDVSLIITALSFKLGDSF